MLNETKDYNKLNNLYQNFNSIKNTYFSETKDFMELPKLYPLNQKSWLNFSRNKEDKEKELAFKGNFYFKGKFYSKILTIKLKLKNKCDTYCFFYLDEKKDMKQGYIKINSKEKEKEIMNTLKDGPLEFINNLRNNNSNCVNEWLSLNYIELFFPENKKIKTNNNYTSFFEGKKSIILNPQNKKIDNTNLEIKNSMDKNYNILKKSFRKSQMSLSLISNSTLDNENDTSENISDKKINIYNNNYKINDINN